MDAKPLLPFSFTIDDDDIKCCGARRSGQWPAVRRRWLEQHQVCEFCRGKSHLEVHHICPFHTHPAIELAEGNLMTLCERPGRCCHHVFGHLHDWRKINHEIDKSLIWWKRLLAVEGTTRHRPHRRFKKS